MVHALREAHRVLKPSGVLIDVRPLTEPMVVEVVAAAGPVWAKTVDVCGAPEDVAAADAAVGHALAHQWFAFEQRQPFEIQIFCDTAADLSLYAQGRKMRESEIPYDELEARRREVAAGDPTARLRCRRPWMLTTYRKSPEMHTGPAAADAH
jgi:hypothetical protein